MTVDGNKVTMTTDELRTLLGEAGGATSAPFMQDHPTYVMPSERIIQGINRVWVDHGLPGLFAVEPVLPRREPDLTHDYLARTAEERRIANEKHGMPWRVKAAVGLGNIACPMAPEPMTKGMNP